MLINDLRSDVFSSYLFALAGCLDQRSAGRGATADLAAGICQRPARRACDIALDRPGIVQNDAIVPDGCEVAIDRPGRADRAGSGAARPNRSEEHTSELQSLMRISYPVFCLNKKMN